MARPDQYQEMRDVWTDFNKRQEFEHGLINTKTTWLLTTQALLFAAYGVTFNAPKSQAEVVASFRGIVADLGVAIAVVVLVGVLALIRSKYLSWRTYATSSGASHPIKLPGPLEDLPLEWGVRTGNTLVTLVPDVAIPLVFIVAWGSLAS